MNIGGFIENIFLIPEKIPVTGKVGRLFFYKETGKVYELNPDTLVVINSGTFAHWGGVSGGGVGGISNRLYQTDRGVHNINNVNEINPDNFVRINYANLSDSDGTGGNSDMLLISSVSPDYIAEINPDSLVEIRRETKTRVSRDTGGMETRVFYSDWDKYFEMNPENLLNINSVNIVKNICGIGGINKKLYIAFEWNPPICVQEVNPDNGAVINSATIDSALKTLSVGGI